MCTERVAGSLPDLLGAHGSRLLDCARLDRAHGSHLFYRASLLRALGCGSRLGGEPVGHVGPQPRGMMCVCSAAPFCTHLADLRGPQGEQRACWGLGGRGGRLGLEHRACLGGGLAALGSGGLAALVAAAEQCEACWGQWAGLFVAAVIVTLSLRVDQPHDPPASTAAAAPPATAGLKAAPAAPAAPAAAAVLVLVLDEVRAAFFWASIAASALSLGDGALMLLALLVAATCL